MNAIDTTDGRAAGSAKYCETCGTQLTGGRFCPGCGHPVAGAEAQTQRLEPPPVAAPAPVSPPPPPVAPPPVTPAPRDRTPLILGLAGVAGVIVVGVVVVV